MRPILDVLKILRPLPVSGILDFMVLKIFPVCLLPKQLIDRWSSAVNHRKMVYREFQQSFFLNVLSTMQAILSTMQAVLFFAALALGAAAQQDLTVNTPTVDGVPGIGLCQPLLLSWSGGTPPYIAVSLAFVSAAFGAGADSSRCAFIHSLRFVTLNTFLFQRRYPCLLAQLTSEFDGQTGTSVTWLAVNATVGTKLLLTIKDNTGLTKNSGSFPVTVVANGTKSCLVSHTDDSNPGESSTVVPGPTGTLSVSTGPIASSTSSANTGSPTVQPGGQSNLRRASRREHCRGFDTRA
ncbi:Protein disulfide-isomerase erp38 [Mycena venus]|uniref:Protein disulfide-isomerase erp38 n=1 Tax=Mycena venus TaxID=2733690 RepID=A0A8H7CB69_9AGAR|nr:Protein disulfide-isomerase erp38 [Mycena venus]